MRSLIEDSLPRVTQAAISQISVELGALSGHSRFGGDASLFLRMHELHGAGLRAVLTGLFDEVDVASDPKMLESPLQHAVAVKIDFPAIRRFEEPVARLREQFGHFA
jgi:hypothetical protein